MKKTFVIQVEYPDNDVIPSEEIMEVTQECIENHLERFFGANIMDGDYDRIKVKEVTDGFALVKEMREAQREFEKTIPEDYDNFMSWMEESDNLESKVDEWIKEIEENHEL